MGVINKIADKLLELGEDIRGVSPAYIETLESIYGYSLPATYKEFLLLIGQSAGFYLVGSSIFKNRLDDREYPLEKSAKELLQENNHSFSLPETAYVFWMHQGYQFAFFLLNEGSDDPTVFYYNEANSGEHEAMRGFFKDYDRLSEFFEDEFKAHLGWRGISSS